MSARARGRKGGRPYKMTVPKLRLAQAAMAKRGTRVGDLCKELGVTRQTLYRFVDPEGDLRSDARELLKAKGRKPVAFSEFRERRQSRRRMAMTRSRRNTLWASLGRAARNVTPLGAAVASRKGMVMQELQGFSGVHTPLRDRT